MKHFTSRVLLVLIFCIFAGTFNACLDDRAPVQANENGEANSMAVNVRINQVQLTSFHETLRLLGETQANRDVTYSAEVAGRLEFLAVDYGDTVSKGQLLARVDFEMLSAQAEQAQAAYTLASKTFERLETLLKDELITQQRIDEANSALIQAEAQHRQMQTALKHSQIRSTIDGVIARKFVEEGEYLMPGSPILRILDYSEIIITAQAPEKRISEIRPGLDVAVWIDALNETFSGKVDVVLPNADPDSRTFTIRVRTPNDDGRILVGMAATLSIQLKEHTDAIVIPQDVVVERTGKRFVFVADNGVARQIPVTLGPSEGHSVMITSGLNEADLVIVEGQRELVDGQPINIIQ